MVIFRPKKKGIIESVLSSKEFISTDEMKNFLSSTYNANVDDICIEGPKFSDYLGWNDSQSVCIKSLSQKICIGFCATMYWNNK